MSSHWAYLSVSTALARGIDSLKHAHARQTVEEISLIKQAEQDTAFSIDTVGDKISKFNLSDSWESNEDDQIEWIHM